MMALLVAAATAAVPVLPLAELPPQTLAPNSCAMFLWDRTSEKRVVMAVAQPPFIRINSGGVRDLGRRDASGTPVMGFSPRASFADAKLTITLDLVIKPNPASVGGAVIRDGVMITTAPDGESIVSPVAGLIGCQTSTER
jgi:hypothetical protein